MRIAVVFRADYGSDGLPVPAYPWSYVAAFREMGHEVEAITRPEQDWSESPDLVLEIENGRDENGELPFRVAKAGGLFGVPSAVLLIDSHGHPDLHAEIAKRYSNVFFAVWSRRDLFAGHHRAHWCPNATDLHYFGAENFQHITPEFDVGFFGSKKGLDRARDLVDVCKLNGWTYDVRQVASNRNPNRWPATGEAMAKCRVLFNRSQKHDGPNQRVMESMAMGRPLLCDFDARDGMRQLFTPEEHYMPYTNAAGIEWTMKALQDGNLAHKIASAARREVEAKHLVKHRAAQILEVVCSS